MRTLILAAIAASMLLSSSSAQDQATVTRPVMSEEACPLESAVPVNSTHQNIFWMNGYSVVGMSDADLDTWKNRGVGGFNCATQQLKGMGGTQDFTGDPNSSLQGSNYDLQRSMRNSRIVQRLHARGMKIYMGFYVANYNKPLTPFGDWFDDATWANTVNPRVQDLAAMAKLEGFDGITLDQEGYPGRGGRHTWNVSYPSHPAKMADS